MNQSGLERLDLNKWTILFQFPFFGMICFPNWQLNILYKRGKKVLLAWHKKTANLFIWTDLSHHKKIQIDSEINFSTAYALNYVVALYAHEFHIWL